MDSGVLRFTIFRIAHFQMVLYAYIHVFTPTTASSNLSKGDPLSFMERAKMQIFFGISSLKLLLFES